MNSDISSFIKQGEREEGRGRRPRHWMDERESGRKENGGENVPELKE